MADKNAIYDWSSTPTDNDNVGGVNIAEECAISNLNNSDRTAMSQIRDWSKDLGAVNTVGGTGDAITVTLSSDPTAYVDGMRFMFTASAANTGATTINVTPATGGALGSRKVQKIASGSATALAAGDIGSGAFVELVYDSAADSGTGAWILLTTVVPEVDNSAIEADIAALETNAAFLAFRVADLEGVRLNMVGGIADAYDSEDDVDTATSTNETYDPENDLYSPTATGGNDSFTKVLLHFDGADGSTTITDDNAGGSAHSWTAGGNAQLDNGITPKFGTAALLCDGTGDYVTMPDHADLTLGSDDFTVDFWINPEGDGTLRYICGQSNSGASGSTIPFRVELSTGNVVLGRVYNGSLISVTSTTALTSGWHHVAFVRTGDVLKLFIDGVQEGGNVACTGAIIDSANAMSVGRMGEYAGNPYNGSLDEFRISVGTARWTSNFTPPTEAHATPVSNNMTLVSDAFTATAVPTTARVALFVDPQESITINTDLTAEVSRDGGTTWTAGTLALVSNPVGTVEQYEAASIDISAQPSGSSMKYRIKTLNNKDIDATGIVFQWS